MSATLTPLNRGENGLYWDGWTRSGTEAWIQVILHGILCLLSLLLLYLYVSVFSCNNEFPCINRSRMNSNDNNSASSPSLNQRHSMKPNNSNGLTINLRILLFLAILSTVIYNFAMYFGSVLLILVFNIRMQKGCLYRVNCIGICGIQRKIAYIFVLIRFDRAFKGTIFSISKLKLRTLIISIVIVYTLFQCCSAYGAYKINNISCDINESIILYIVILSVPATDIIVCSTLTYMFLWRLKEITLKQDNDIVTLNMKQIVRKMSLLSSVTLFKFILSTNIFHQKIYKYSHCNGCIHIDCNIRCNSCNISISIIWIGFHY